MPGWKHNECDKSLTVLLDLYRANPLQPSYNNDATHYIVRITFVLGPAASHCDRTLFKIKYVREYWKTSRNRAAFVFCVLTIQHDHLYSSA